MLVEVVQNPEIILTNRVGAGSVEMNDYRIRPAEPSDGERVAEMAAALSAHEGAPPPPFDAGTFRRFGFGEGRRFEAIIAEDQALAAGPGAAIGYALYNDMFHVGLGTPGLHMIDLFVEPGCRRMGVGRGLIATLARICRERDGTWMTWQSLPSNTEAMAFYDHIKGRRFNAANFELAGEALSATALLG
jgi:ribosomal protein S18 acetylase RimI-like enzyme